MDKKSKTEYIKKTFEIDKDLFHEFNVVAAQKDRKHKEIVNELLRNYVHKNNSSELSK